MARHNEVGKWGEEMATVYLREKGYAILARDWRSGHRDLDIVAITPDGKTMVFVEVKTRTSSFLSPVLAVDIKKARNICLAANQFIKQCDLERNIRFDIISIVGENELIASIEHIEDAFKAQSVLWHPWRGRPTRW